MGSAEDFYDAFGQDYDRFVNWDARLGHELPFLLHLLRNAKARSVLDAACGTGHHAAALAQAGYRVAAADISSEMVAQARAVTAAAGVMVDVQQAGFGELTQVFDERFDALICLGNSLPHLTTPEALREGLRDFNAALRPDGILILQSRNFQRVLAQHERFMSPESHLRGDQEAIFWRFYDFMGDKLRFNLVRLYREGANPWVAQVDHTWLRGWALDEMEEALAAVGFAAIEPFGSLTGEPYRPEESGDLVLVARAATIGEQ